MGLLSFRSTVNELARRKTGELHANTGVQHAKVVVDELLATATESADIYSAGLDAQVHDKMVYEHLIKKVGPDKVRVVLTADKDNWNNELVEMLNSGGVKIRKFHEIGSHIIVVDGESFRVETDVEEMRAFFAFGGDRSKEIQDLFDTIWKSASDLRQ